LYMSYRINFNGRAVKLQGTYIGGPSIFDLLWIAYECT
jgi:hypothetical protein